MKIIGIIILLFELASCVDSTSLDYLESITDSNENSGDSRIGRRRSKRSANRCEDSDRCKNICDQMLDYSSERKDCYRLSLQEIGKIEEAFDILKESAGRLARLNDIRERDFDLFASVALSSWSNVIRGEYRRDEEDDDDKDMDDPGRMAYTDSEAEIILTWIISHRSIAESIRDFSGKNNHIVADLLVRIGGPLDCTGSGNDAIICNELESGSLTDGEKSILENIRDYLGLIVVSSNSDDEVSAIYELAHDVLSRVCENIDSIGGYGRENSYKICLSWLYFCPSVYDTELLPYSSNQIDQYLLKDTYRTIPQGSLRNCTFLTTEPKWSDYWN